MDGDRDPRRHERPGSGELVDSGVSSSRSSPTIRDRQKAYTRAHLIEAARQLFRTQGFDTTSVDQIAKQAGTSRATFYLHFGQKTDVALAIGDEMWAVAERFFAELAHLPAWSTTEIRRWIEGDVAQWHDKQRIVDALADASLGGSGTADQIVERVDAIATGSVAQGGHWSRWPADEARLRALVVVELLVGYFQHWQDRGFVAGEEVDLALLTRVVATSLDASPD